MLELVIVSLVILSLGFVSLGLVSLIILVLDTNFKLSETRYGYIRPSCNDEQFSYCEIRLVRFRKWLRIRSKRDET